MIFSSPVFVLLFLPVVLLATVASPRSWRNAVLLLASLFFYAWGEGPFVLVMLSSIAANFGFGLWIERAHTRAAGKRASRLPLWLAVAFNLGLLSLFKYADWLRHEAGQLLGIRDFGKTARPFLDQLGLVETYSEGWRLHLPIGISFFTFQALSYVVDVHRRSVPAQRSLLRFGMYVSLFPQLIAGPIVRYRDIAAEIASRSIRVHEFAEGVRRFVIGLAKKLLIANALAQPVDRIFDLPTEQIAPSVAWVAMVGYGLQIYFDFSGYSDMAIGLGRMLGFRFLENFRHPYVSRSITDFWRRWHISLSSWFRDYLYIPLGGNRAGRTRTYLNLLIVFALCGLWHGASWSFLVWGLYHGAFLILERAGGATILERLPSVLRLGYALLAVFIGWVFFRAETLPQALGLISAAFGAPGEKAHFTNTALYLTPHVKLVLVAGIVACAPWLDVLRKLRSRLATNRRRTLAFEAMSLLATGALFYGSLLELAAGTYNPFIYFRF